MNPCLRCKPLPALPVTWDDAGAIVQTGQPQIDAERRTASPGINPSLHSWTQSPNSPVEFILANLGQDDVRVATTEALDEYMARGIYDELRDVRGGHVGRMHPAAVTTVPPPIEDGGSGENSSDIDRGIILHVEMHAAKLDSAITPAAELLPAELPPTAPSFPRDERNTTRRHLHRRASSFLNIGIRATRDFDWCEPLNNVPPAPPRRC